MSASSGRDLGGTPPAPPVVVSPRERPISFGGPMVKAILAGKKTQTRRALREGRIRVRLPREVCSDIPFLMPIARAAAGVHRATIHRGGAVSVQLGGDPTNPANLLGVKPGEFEWVSPYGRIGDRLWVKETWSPDHRWIYPCPDIVYRADDQVSETERAYHRDCSCEEQNLADCLRNFRWRPPRFMPRRAARILLEVTAEARVERLQSISWADIKAEGVACPEHDGPGLMCVGECQAARGAYERLWGAINGPDSWVRNDWVLVVQFRRVRP